MLHVTDTARGAVWKVAIGPDGKGDKPILLAQSPLLEGADGLAFDRNGKLWVVANERNAVVTVLPDGQVQVAKNGSRGPLEFPVGIVFVGGNGLFPTSIRRGAITWTQTAIPRGMASAPRSLRSLRKHGQSYK